ncbi:permease-like cell division protein FtsX [Actinomadura latina]|uniref:FtsX extracellular domain-containing protein n=1 Tax=Actinomadura latina TaxID=163603 RepID=A0A846YXC4_9ACTN|nr:permease-like cell division protein FtsX [Actinomadura latina]NKZ02763.1 hypothetical protein [Actinomadura latina]
MNATEERLRDALQTVGDTVRPEDMPEPRFAARRRRLPLPAMAMAAVAASAAAAVAVGGAVVGGAFTAGGPNGLSAPSSGSSAPAVLVFLCTKTSANQGCDHKGATQQQKEEVRRVLSELPKVRGVEFENKGQAYMRFKKRFKGDEQFRRSVDAGDIPEAFRVALVPGADGTKVRMAVLGMPGVDTAIVEKR